MLMSLKEAFFNFNEKHSMKIGLSKFCDFRPKNVKLFEHILCVFLP